MSEPVPPSNPVLGHVPGQHQIEAYGRGGFRFAGMSHRGSILALPSGVTAWDVADIRTLTLAHLAPVLSAVPPVEFLIVGTGTELFPIPADIRAHLRGAGIALDGMQTGPAARTYNVLVAEGRRVAAALVAVEQ